MFTTRRILIVVLVLGIICMLSGIGLILYQRTTIQPQTQQIITQEAGIISGTFDINGVIPDGATIAITLRDISRPDTQTADSDITAVDEGTWSLTDVELGKSYEIVANVTSANEIIGSSAPLTVTAPASNVVLSINLPLNEPQNSAVISGTIRVNGYIPSGATITIQGRKLGDSAFEPIVQGLPSDQRQFMSYATAIAGQTYEVYGILYDRTKKQIGSSAVLVLTAPALNEQLTINSQAVMPTGTPTVPPTSPTTTQSSTTVTPTSGANPTPTPISLSGSITFNGVAPVNSRIVILQKVYNTTQYQVAVDNITPVDGTTWTWSGASGATWYDVIAILKQTHSNGTDTDIATSQSLSAAAPAAGLTFVINSSVSLSAPSGPITVTCNSLSGSTYSATISMGSVTGAQTYWYQIGTTNGGTETANTVLSPVVGQSLQTVNLSLSKGTTYYVRYAYATVAGVPAGSTQFSPFSSTTQVQCN